jgi:hypothetical protein
MKSCTPRRPRPARPTSVPPVAPPLGAPGVSGRQNNAPAPAPDTPPALSGSPRRPWLSGVELSFLWLLVVGCWIFAGPRGTGAFPLPIAYTTVALTIAALVCLGRRWLTFGYLVACFVTGLLGMPRPWRGRRW